MTTPVLVPIPRAVRPVGIVEHDGVLDFYIAPNANVTRAELMAQAEEFGSVDDEGRYLRLFVSPVYEQSDVVAYFRALYPAYEVTE